VSFNSSYLREEVKVEVAFGEIVGQKDSGKFLATVVGRTRNKDLCRFILSGFDAAANSNQLTKSITISPSLQQQDTI